MNEIVNKFLLAGDKFMPEMHLKQPGFTYLIKFKEIKHLISLNMMGIKEDLRLWFTIFLIKSRQAVVSLMMRLAKELHKPIIRNFKKRSLFWI